MNEHTKRTQTLGIIFVFLLVVFISLFCTRQWIQLNKTTPVIGTNIVGSNVDTGTPEITKDDEVWAQEQQRMAIEEAKANPIYILPGTVVSISATSLEMDIPNDPAYPVTGKQIIAVDTKLISIAKATCVISPNVDADFPPSCTTENIALSDLKQGDKISVSLDKDIFINENGTLVAQSILVQ